MNEMEEQLQIEADSLHNGVLEYLERLPYRAATDTKPGRVLLRKLLDGLIEPILQEQLALKRPGSGKLPRHGVPFLSLAAEKLALITLGVVFAYFFRKTLIERLLIVLSAIPIAILVNSFRATSSAVQVHSVAKHTE